jgi:hypothetical protein
MRNLNRAELTPIHFHRVGTTHRYLPINCRAEHANNGLTQRSNKFHHSMTSSARTKSVGGIVNPSALARRGRVPPARPSLNAPL